MIYNRCKCLYLLSISRQVIRSIKRITQETSSRVSRDRVRISAGATLCTLRSSRASGVPNGLLGDSGLCLHFGLYRESGRFDRQAAELRVKSKKKSSYHTRTNHSNRYLLICSLKRHYEFHSS